jgi:3-oxoacyl-[acyl-carrier protein] reductase
MENKTLLVIGASSDIGRALIARLAPRYTKIYAHYNAGVEAVQELQSQFGTKIIPVQADLLNAGAVSALTKQIAAEGVPDHIVHLAAPKCIQQRFHQTSPEDFQTALTCSLISFSSIIQPFISKMGKNGTGKIVVMLTAYTENVPPKFISPYVTAKYALLGLVRALAAEYAPKGVCVNAVSPEMMDTRFLEGMPELALEQARESSVMGRLLVPGDVVPTFEYLLSDSSDCVTGQNVLITGVKRSPKN